MRNKERETAIRKEVAIWQAVAVLFAAAIVFFAACAIIVSNRWSTEREDLCTAIMEWEKRYNAAKAIEQDAVAAYGEKVAAYDRLVAAVELEQTKREEQARAYEALGEYRYVGVCTLTAYCCESKGNPHICGDGDGLTATGLPVAPGMVAVDPEVIPLGSTVIIDGTRYLAADTGVKGYHIDIAIQTHEDALDFGISSADVWIIPSGSDENGK